MSSPRPATLFAALFQRLSRSFIAPPVPEGPGCSCASCEEAWLRHHPLDAARVAERTDLRLPLAR